MTRLVEITDTTPNAGGSTLADFDLLVGPKPGNQVNWIGDSIAPVLGSPGIGGAAGTVALGPSDFLAWAHWLSNGKILYGKPAGVTGQVAGQMVPRIVADALSNGGRFCGITTGTNDAANAVSGATYAANIRTMCASIIAAAQTPILTSGFPNPSSGAPNLRVAADRYRRFVESYAAANGWPFVDTFNLMQDPATNGYLSQYDIGDGTHPSNVGKKAIGQALSDALSPFMPPFQVPLAVFGDQTQTVNLIANALLAGAGTPTSWTKTGAIACTTGTDGAVVGQWMRLLDAASAGFTQVNQAIAGGAVPLRGHKIAFSGLFKAVGTNQWSINLSTNGTNPMSLFGTSGLTVPTPGWQKFYLEGIVPADATTMTASFFTNGGAAQDAYVAQLGVYDLTAAGV